MSAHQPGKPRRPFSYDFEYKVRDGHATWQARIKEGSGERDIDGKFDVSTLAADETFEQRVVSEIHRVVDALPG